MGKAASCLTRSRWAGTGFFRLFKPLLIKYQALDKSVFYFILSVK